MTCYDQSDVFLDELLECFKESCNDREITVTYTGCSRCAAYTKRSGAELIDEGCNVLCVNLADRTDPSEIIDMARGNGMFRLSFFLTENELPSILRQWDNLYYVGAYSKQSGIMQGKSRPGRYDLEK